MIRRPPRSTRTDTLFPYTTLFRSLLQIFVWYFAVLGAMPHPRNAMSLFDAFFLTNRGLYSPAPVFEPGFWAIPIAFVVAVAAVVLLVRWARRRQDATGQRFRSEERRVGEECVSTF